MIDEDIACQLSSAATVLYNPPSGINTRTCLLRTQQLPRITLNQLCQAIQNAPLQESSRRLRESFGSLLFELKPFLTSSKRPVSQLYSHILTSCFIDTILIPICTWLYLLFLVMMFMFPAIFKSRARRRFSPGDDISKLPKRHGRVHRAFKVLYGLLILAQALMCTLEIVRLSLALLGIGLLPFTYVGLLIAFALRMSQKFRGPIQKWRWANLFLWISLAVANVVKLSGELKEGINSRKGSKYPMIDQITDIGVMIGVYLVLGVIDVCLKP